LGFPQACFFAAAQFRCLRSAEHLLGALVEDGVNGVIFVNAPNRNLAFR
jgi:hypothetical protein